MLNAWVGMVTGHWPPGVPVDGGTVEPRYNDVLGTMKITLLYQISHYIRVKKQRNIESWDQQNYLVIRGFCYIRPLYNEVPLYHQCVDIHVQDTVMFITILSGVHLSTNFCNQISRMIIYKLLHTQKCTYSCNYGISISEQPVPGERPPNFNPA